jgi:biopolymer transport protein ExbD
MVVLGLVDFIGVILAIICFALSYTYFSSRKSNDKMKKGSKSQERKSLDVVSLPLEILVDKLEDISADARTSEGIEREVFKAIIKKIDTKNTEVTIDKDIQRRLIKLLVRLIATEGITVDNSRDSIVAVGILTANNMDARNIAGELGAVETILNHLNRTISSSMKENSKWCCWALLVS